MTDPSVVAGTVATIVVGVAGIGGTLWGTLGASRIAARNQKEILQATRSIEINDMQRGAVAHVLSAAQLLLDEMAPQSQVHALQRSREDAERFRHEVMKLGANTPRSQLRDAATIARLVINDEEIRRAIAAVTKMQTNWFLLVLEPNEESIAVTPLAAQERINRGEEFHRGTLTLFGDLERLTRERLGPFA